MDDRSRDKAWQAIVDEALAKLEMANEAIVSAKRMVQYIREGEDAADSAEASA